MPSPGEWFSVYVFETRGIKVSFFFLGSQILYVILLYIFRLFDIYELGMCHFIDCKANLNNALPSMDAFHPTHEVIRGDRQHLKSNFL